MKSLLTLLAVLPAVVGVKRACRWEDATCQTAPAVDPSTPQCGETATDGSCVALNVGAQSVAFTIQCKGAAWNLSAWIGTECSGTFLNSFLGDNSTDCRALSYMTAVVAHVTVDCNADPSNTTIKTPTAAPTQASDATVAAIGLLSLIGFFTA